jgi:hypothetical protein
MENDHIQSPLARKTAIMKLRDIADRFSRWLMGLGAAGLLSVVIAWATATRTSQSMWPIWLYWMCGAIYGAGLLLFVTSHGRLSQLRDKWLWRLRKHNGPAAVSLAPSHANPAEEELPIRIRLIPKVLNDTQLIIMMTNEGESGFFHCMVAEIQYYPYRQDGHREGRWPITWIDDEGGAPARGEAKETARLYRWVATDETARLYLGRIDSGASMKASGERRFGLSSPTEMDYQPGVGAQLRVQVWIRMRGSTESEMTWFILGVSDNGIPFFEGPVDPMW